MKKIIISESQYNLLNEQVGIDDFMVKVSERYPDSVYSLRVIADFIKNSECKKIGVTLLRHKVNGISLMNGVTLDKDVFLRPFNEFLYILFHEIAHQYQYKKYGIDKMYACYTGDITVEEGAKWMQETEKIADEFSIRKLKEVKKLFSNRFEIDIPEKVYDTVPLEHFNKLITFFIGEIKKQGYKNKEDISEILFNYVKL